MLLGVAALLAASTTIVLTGAFAGKSALVAGAVLLAAAGFAGLAYLVRRAPRVGGWLLLSICGVPVAMAMAHRGEPQVVWTAAVMVQAVAGGGGQWGGVGGGGGVSSCADPAPDRSRQGFRAVL
ncbi:MAG: hypothetical protein IPH86_18460 [bacterium]|nr:hypothetical protein [bacterium]